MYCITETWLSSFVFDNEIFPSGYTIFRKDRGTRSGGVMIAVKDSIPCKQMPSPSCLEVVTISFCLSDSFVLCLIYSPPNASDDYHSNLVKYLSSLQSYSSTTLILGDFNAPDINWSTLSGSSTFSNSLCELVFNLNLSTYSFSR